ncbi:unnamed protein product, partial [Adineta steineri]
LWFLAKLIAMIILNIVNSVQDNDTSNGIDLNHSYTVEETDEGPLEHAKETFSEFISSGDPTYIRTIPRMLKIMRNISDVFIKRNSAIFSHKSIEEILIVKFI